MSSVATGVAGAGRTFERVSVVKALAGRKVPASVAHAFAPGGAELVVVEKYKDGLDAAALDQLERDARTMMALRHPNVATVRDVWREDGALCVASEYVEGETLEELRRVGAGGKDFSIEVGVRVVVDVLAALSAIHGHAQAGLSHGEVTAANVVVGFDGTTRLVHPFRGRVAGKVAEADLFSYVAPEVVKGGASDVRADLYAVGVILWETLSRRKLFPKATREGRAARSMPVGKPVPPPDTAWAAPLGAVAERALANDPSARYTTGAEMAAAVRLAVRSKLAMPPRVSAAVDKLAGEKILSRRNTNALPDPSAAATGGARASVRPARPSVPPEAVRALSAIRPSSRPPPPKATPAPPPMIPKMPPLPSLETPKPGEAKPRPIAPPLKLAEPKPPPPIVAPPSEILDAFVESVREPAPPPAPPPPVAQAEPVVVSPSQPQRRRAIVWIAVAVLCALVALAAVVGVAISGSSSKNTLPVPSGHPSARETSTATSATPVTTTATTSAASTTTAGAGASASAEPSATADPEPTTTAPVDSSHRPHTRPRPTYDPMGI